MIQRETVSKKRLPVPDPSRGGYAVELQQKFPFVSGLIGYIGQGDVDRG